MFKFEVSMFGMLSHKICILFFFSCKYVYKMKIHFSFFLVYSYVQRSVRRSGRVKKFILNQKNSKTEPWCSQYRFKTLPQISPSLSSPLHLFNSSTSTARVSAILASYCRLSASRAASSIEHAQLALTAELQSEHKCTQAHNERSFRSGSTSSPVLLLSGIPT